MPSELSGGLDQRREIVCTIYVYVPFNAAILMQFLQFLIDFLLLSDCTVQGFNCGEFNEVNEASGAPRRTRRMTVVVVARGGPFASTRTSNKVGNRSDEQTGSTPFEGEEIWASIEKRESRNQLNEAGRRARARLRRKKIRWRWRWDVLRRFGICTSASPTAGYAYVRV